MCRKNILFVPLKFRRGRGRFTALRRHLLLFELDELAAEAIVRPDATSSSDQLKCIEQRHVFVGMQQVGND